MLLSGWLVIFQRCQLGQPAHHEPSPFSWRPVPDMGGVVSSPPRPASEIDVVGAAASGAGPDGSPSPNIFLGGVSFASKPRFMGAHQGCGGRHGQIRGIFSRIMPFACPKPALNVALLDRGGYTLKVCSHSFCGPH